MLFSVLDYHLVLVCYNKEQYVFLINFKQMTILLKMGVLVALSWSRENDTNLNSFNKQNNNFINGQLCDSRTILTMISHAYTLAVSFCLTAELV